MSETKNFSARCQAEGTRDVIFLFQYRNSTLVGLPYATSVGEYGDDGEGIRLGAVDRNGEWSAHENSPCLTTDELRNLVAIDGLPCIRDQWVTEGAWITREEATAHGEAHSYNYPDGWRVYGICSNGDLAELLKTT